MCQHWGDLLDTVTSILDDVASILLTDCANYKESESVNPKPTYPYVITYLLQYVRGTVSNWIQLSGSIFDLLTFTDASGAGDILTR